MNTLRMLATEVGVSERTLRRALNEGALRGTRQTPHTLELPLSERRYIRRSWPLLSRLRRALRTEPNVRFALLFGSTAMGTDTAGSDIDLLVELRDPGLDRVIELNQRLAAAAGRRVEIVRLEDAEADPGLLADWVEQGRVLVDRKGSWAELRRRAAALRRRARDGAPERARAALEGIDRMLAG